MPSGGTLGTAFDALVGVRIARATLCARLEQLAGGIEAEYTARINR